MMHFPSKILYMVLFIPYMVFVDCILEINQSISIFVQAKDIKDQKIQILPLFHCISMGQAMYIQE